MKFNIRGSKVKITSAINDYIEAKIGKLDKYLENPDEITANVVVRVKGNDQTVEVTIPMKKIILRAEDTHNDLYAAVDLVSDKLERQIRRHKTKANKKIREREGISNYFINMDDTPEVYNKHDEIPYKIKNVHLKPMDVEEAIMQLELLGHDFYVYRDMEVDTVCVVYRRKDGKYAVIETNH